MDNGSNEKAMFLDKSSHPAPEPGDNSNQLCGSLFGGGVQPAGELGPPTPSCAWSRCRLTGMSSARLLTGAWTSSWSSLTGKKLRDQYLLFNLHIGELRPTGGKGSDSSKIRTEPRLLTSLPWTTCGAATRYFRSCIKLDAWAVELGREGLVDREQ